MAIQSVGDLAQAFLLRSQSARLQSDLTTRTQEVSSGQIADLGKAVSGNFSPLAAIEATLGRMTGYKVATDSMTLQADTMQAALGDIGQQASTLASNLLSASTASLPAQIDALGTDAASRLDAVLSGLNTQVSGRSLFAGVATDGPAVASSGTILTVLQTATAGATSAQDVANAVSAWFDDPAGYASQGYAGSDQPQSAIAIGDTQTGQLPFTANDPAVRETLKGLAMAALLDRGVLAGNATERTRLATLAGQQLMSATTPFNEMRASLGVAQQRIDTAATGNGAQAAAMEQARAAIVAADPYKAATALQNTQTQLQALYAVTARLSQLSLVNFMK